MSEKCQPVIPDITCGKHAPWNASTQRLQVEHTMRDWRASRLRGMCIVPPPLDLHKTSKAKP